ALLESKWDAVREVHSFADQFGCTVGLSIAENTPTAHNRFRPSTSGSSARYSPI
ncbi:hypothetical protein T265_05618, partial [Opisthorchis viverrini]